MIQPRKACNYPNLRSFGWVSYNKVGALYSGKLGNRSEASASDLRSYPGLWWNRMKLRLSEGKESEYSPRTCSIGRPAGGTLCPHLHTQVTCPTTRSLERHTVNLAPRNGDDQPERLEVGALPRLSSYLGIGVLWPMNAHPIR